MNRLAPTIKEIAVDKPGCRRIEIIYGHALIEISQLGPEDSDGPGDIGIVPVPREMSQDRVIDLLKTAPGHKLVVAALKALRAGTADFYGTVPSRSVVAALDARKRPSQTDIAIAEYKQKIRKRRA